MEVSATKGNVVNMGTRRGTRTTINGKKLECVSKFKYLGSAVIDDASLIAEIKMTVATVISALAKLNSIWRDKKISLTTRMNLLRSLVTSVVKYSCKTWTITAEMEKHINAFDNELFIQLTQ